MKLLKVLQDELQLNKRFYFCSLRINHDSLDLYHTTHNERFFDQMVNVIFRDRLPMTVVNLPISGYKGNMIKWCKKEKVHFLTFFYHNFLSNCSCCNIFWLEIDMYVVTCFTYYYKDLDSKRLAFRAIVKKWRNL